MLFYCWVLLAIVEGEIVYWWGCYSCCCCFTSFHIFDAGACTWWLQFPCAFEPVAANPNLARSIHNAEAQHSSQSACQQTAKHSHHTAHRLGNSCWPTLVFVYHSLWAMSRLHPDPSVGVGDLQRCFLKFMDDAGSNGLSQLLKNPKVVWHGRVRPMRNGLVAPRQHWWSTWSGSVPMQFLLARRSRMPYPKSCLKIEGAIIPA